MSFQLRAQRGNVSFERIGVEQGLSHVTVNVMSQDSYGFIWLGTTDGLNRYDGYDFTIFKNDPNNPESLRNNSITGIYEAKDGALWVGTFEGLHRYDRDKQSFIHFSLGLETLKINEIIGDGKDGLWVASAAGLVRLNISTQVYENIDLGEKAGQLHRLLRAKDGLLWIGTLDNGIFRYNPESGEFRHFDGNGAEYPIWDLYEDDSSVIWAASNGGGLKFYDAENDVFKRLETPHFSNDKVLSVYEDRLGYLWVGTEGGGLIKLTPDRKRVYRYNHRSQDLNSLSSTDVRSIFQDKSGMLWFGTWGGGVNLMNPDQARFTNYTPGTPETRHALSNEFVQSVIEDRSGNIWVGTKKGLNRVDAGTQLVEQYFHGPDKVNSLSNDYIKSLYQDSRGDLWIGTQNGLNLFDPVSNSFQRIFQTGSSDGISHNDHTFFFEDSQSNLWIGTWNGLNKYDLPAEKFQNKSIPAALRDKAILSMTEDRRGNLWLGTYYDGLYQYHPESGNLTQFKREVDNPSSLSNNRIWALHTDPAGIVWVGTFGGGLNKVINQGGQVTFERITEHDGLANNAVISIQSDDTGCLWVSGNKGLSKFDPRQFVFVNYDQNDGLQGDHFNAASYKGESGKLYFGGSKGLTVFEPESILADRPEMRVIINNFELFNKTLEPKDSSVLVANILNTSEVTLNHAQSVFSFGFTSDNFNQPEKHLYAYKLEGFDEEWIYTSATRRYVTYTSIPADTYTFSVKSANKHGFWGAPTTIKLIILPPWWKTWWFRVALVLVVIGSIYLIYLSRISVIKRQKEQLEGEVEIRTAELRKSKDKAVKDKELIERQAEKLRELDEVKSRFFANISHELRTPLTLINAPLESLIENGEIKNEEVRAILEVARKNGASLLSLVEEILDLAKLDAGKLKLVENPVRVYDCLIDVVDSYAEGFRQKGINFEFDFLLERELTVLMDASKCHKILNNLLSNALKFTTEKGNIALSICKVDGPGNDLLISVSDSGKGIHPDDLPHVFDRYYQSEQPGKKAEGGTGIGLALAKELAELQGGSLSATSEIGKGSNFTFQFPMKKVATNEVIAPALELNEPLIEALSETLVQYNLKFGITKPVLLVTEDHPEMRTFIARTLRPYFEVKEASHGKAALEVLNTMPVDIVISDVMMPEMDGFELLKAIKANKDLRQVSLVMLTARADREDKLEALTLGIDDYLTKPFSAIEFLARIKNILENRIKVIKELGQLEKQPKEEVTNDILNWVSEYGLSEREVDVMKLLAKRYTNAEMADKLCVSPNTVKFHLKNLYLKLGLSSRAEAMSRLGVLSR
ncbi:MAG: response regulator [Roseivirga sp.]|nr:response regulator [Roseivirga sp.]